MTLVLCVGRVRAISSVPPIDWARRLDVDDDSLWFPLN